MLLATHCTSYFEGREKGVFAEGGGEIVFLHLLQPLLPPPSSSTLFLLRVRRHTVLQQQLGKRGEKGLAAVLGAHSTPWL